MYTEKELRKILTNWDIPQNQAISGVRIVDGTKTALNLLKNRTFLYRYSK